MVVRQDFCSSQYRYCFCGHASQAFLQSPAAVPLDMVLRGSLPGKLAIKKKKRERKRKKKKAIKIAKFERTILLPQQPVLLFLGDCTSLVKNQHSKFWEGANTQHAVWDGKTAYITQEKVSTKCQRSEALIFADTVEIFFHLREVGGWRCEFWKKMSKGSRCRNDFRDCLEPLLSQSPSYLYRGATPQVTRLPVKAEPSVSKVEFLSWAMSTGLGHLLLSFLPEWLSE